MPGLGNFVGEFLILLGAYRVSALWTVIGSLGLVAASVYALWMMQAVFHGAAFRRWKLADLSPRETAAMVCMTVIIVWLGLFPRWVLTTARIPLRPAKQAALSLAWQQVGAPALPGAAFRQAPPAEKGNP
jgi:NADH-quinone oxidoreductase subunit M